MREEHPVREMAVPSTTLVTLRQALRSEAGPLPTVHALHAAGYATGEAMAEVFVDGLSRPLDEIPTPEFWHALSGFWKQRGWGTLTHRDVHPGVGLLRSEDWGEVGEVGAESQPSCAFTSGMLASLLGRTADGPVAVLEVTCRSRGDDACVFAFGSETTVHELYGTLLDGATLEDALDGL